MNVTTLRKNEFILGLVRVFALLALAVGGSWLLGWRGAVVLLTATALWLLLVQLGSARRQGALVAQLDDCTRWRQQGEQRFQTIFDNVCDAISLHELTGTIVEVNSAMLQLFGVNGKEALGFTLQHDYAAPGQAGRKILRCWQQVLTGDSVRFEWKARRPGDGSVFDAEVHLSRIELLGRPLIMANVRDISERKAIERKLTLDASVFASTTEGIMVTAADGTIQTVNPAFTAITGYPMAEALGQNPRILKSGRQDAAIYQEIWRQLAETGQWKGVFWNKRKNGEYYPQESTITAIRDEAGQVVHYAAIFSDISERMRTEERLLELCSQDGLTGIANRRTFDETLTEEWLRATRNQTPLALLMLDLDFFKDYNDCYGHQAGDGCLQLVGAVLFDATRRPGDLAARYGGEEFSMILPQTTTAGAMVIAERVRQQVEDLAIPHRCSGVAEVVTLSVGVAIMVPQPGMTLQLLLGRADQALYQAKHSGRNRVFTFDDRAGESRHSA